ncbi:MAG: 3'-5' exonuclease domain-containing protein 2 [Bacteroidaceae bacterium]|nr:3'-5' exonuclease domain-containing protein 2 [Bacteroidaceae bacterium]
MVEIFNTIEKAQVAELSRVEFTGTVVVVDTVEKADQAITELSKYSIVGFDTETRPNFKRGTTNKVSLLQLSTADVAYLFRLHIIGLTDSIVSFLEDSSILKIGISIKDDFYSLQRRRELNPAGFVDLQDLVSVIGIKDRSLQKIYALLFGERISKSQRLSNWEIEEYSESQMQYAAIDAWAALKIYNYLTNLIENKQYKVIQKDAEESIAKEG